MRRQAQEELEAAARRRLELLGRELEQAGLVRREPASGARWTPDDLGPDPDDLEGDDDLPAPEVPSPVGRHARRRARSGVLERAGGALAHGLADRVPETLRGRVSLAPGPAVLVVAVVLLAVVGSALVVGRSRGGSVPAAAVSGPTAAPSPLVSTAPTSGGGAAAGDAAASAPAAGAVGEAAASSTIVVDVAGKVRRRGVLTLPAGSRVVDALEQAGGARPGADLTGLNLARVLVDGEQVVVGVPPQPGGISASVSSGAPAPTGPLVDLNTATAEQLDTLPGVGPVTAEKILGWRDAHGAFSSVDELLEVDGIGEKTLADIAPLVTV